MARVETIAANYAHTDERLNFDRLVADQHARVTRLVSRLLGWSPDVQDVVQDVFVSALTALPRFEGRSRVDTWISRIAVNACRSHTRRQFFRLRRRRPLDDAPDDRPTGGLDTESVTAVRKAIRELPAREREVIVLRYLEDLPAAEIANILGIRKNAVEVRLHRAKKRLEAPLSHLLEDSD